MILSASITAHPGEGRDLVSQARGLLEEIPAFAGKSGKRIRPRLAPHKQGAGAAASGASQKRAASMTSNQTP